MDVKSAFLNGFIKEDVYVEQPSGFEDYKFSNHIYKLKKALYGLEQAPRSWYERLRTFLLENGFGRGKIDSTRTIKRVGDHILLIHKFSSVLRKVFRIIDYPVENLLSVRNNVFRNYSRIIDYHK